MLYMMPDGTVTVTVKNKGTYYVKPGTTLAELLSDVYDDLKVAAKVDNYLQDLNFVLDRSCSVEAVDLSSENGFRIYRRSVVFMLAKACYDLFPERILVTKNSLSNGLYCEFLGCRPSTEEAAALERHMKELSLKNIPINKLQINVKEAEKHLQRQNQREKVRLLESLPDSAVEIYELEGYYEYTYDFMAVNTGMLKTFRLFEYDAGMILQIPGTKNKGLLKPYKEQKKIASLFNEAKEWAGMLQTPNVAALNDIIRQGGLDEIIRVNEALHEKKFAFIADQICQDENIRLILIAGPSASGKTTFAHRLHTQLRVNGKKPVTISLDNYFVNRLDTPVDENNELNYEALEAININMFNQHLKRLMEGDEVELPFYDFKTGSSGLSGQTIHLPAHELIIIEGIHGLNDRLSYLIDPKQKYRIYISAITQINLDNTNYTSTTDNRLMRRIIRDARTRGVKSADTIKIWPSVRRGEENNIFPYQENADIMFNSSLVYELSVLKPFVEPQLRQINDDQEEFAEAQRLLKFLSFFVAAPSEHVPPNSILREFIGGSWFGVV